MPTAASFALSGLVLLASALPAAAFDCNKAQTRVEKAICASDELTAKDAAMAKAYGEVKGLSTEAERKMLAAAQKRWIADRESACGEMAGDELDGCVGDLIDQRLELFEAAPDSGPGGGSRLLPVFVVKDGGPGTYDVAYNLLRFADPRTEGERLFNHKVEEIVAAAPLTQTVEDMDRELASTTDMSLSYVSPKLLSATVSVWSDDGGAHGNGGVSNINIDLTAGREIDIGMVLAEPEAAELVRLCRAQIVAEKKERLEGEAYDEATDDFLKDEVIAEHIATMSRWSLTDEEATVTFDAYAIGSYAEGPYECTFDMGELKQMAKPGAPLP